MKHKLISLFFASMGLFGSAGTVFVYLMLSTVVCDSIEPSLWACFLVTWIFVIFSFLVIVLLPFYIAYRTWK
jgi:hypothetical protein